jgi:hypothetical protein
MPCPTGANARASPTRSACVRWTPAANTSSSPTYRVFVPPSRSGGRRPRSLATTTAGAARTRGPQPIGQNRRRTRHGCAWRFWAGGSCGLTRVYNADPTYSRALVRGATRPSASRVAASGASRSPVVYFNRWRHGSYLVPSAQARRVTAPHPGRPGGGMKSAGVAPLA